MLLLHSFLVYLGRRPWTFPESVESSLVLLKKEECLSECEDLPTFDSFLFDYSCQKRDRHRSTPRCQIHRSIMFRSGRKAVSVANKGVNPIVCNWKTDVRKAFLACQVVPGNRSVVGVVEKEAKMIAWPYCSKNVKKTIETGGK